MIRANQISNFTENYLAEVKFELYALNNIYYFNIADVQIGKISKTVANNFLPIVPFCSQCLW